MCRYDAFLGINLKIKENVMNKIVKLSLALAASVAFASSAYAVGESANLDQNATVKVVNPVTISEGDIMDFGTVIKPASGTQFVMIDKGGIYDASNTATTVSGQGLGGSFDITGSAAATMTISVTSTPAGGLSLTDFTGGMDVGPQTVDASGEIANMGLAGGSDTLMLGAKLTIDGDDAAIMAADGDLVISYNVDVSYD